MITCTYGHAHQLQSPCPVNLSKCISETPLHPYPPKAPSSPHLHTALIRPPRLAVTCLPSHIVISLFTLSAPGISKYRKLHPPPLYSSGLPVSYLVESCTMIVVGSNPGAGNSKPPGGFQLDPKSRLGVSSVCSFADERESAGRREVATRWSLGSERAMGGGGGVVTRRRYERTLNGTGDLLIIASIPLLLLAESLPLRRP